MGVAPPGGGPRIDAAWLTPERTTLFVAFVGGPAYAPTDPCSEDYTAWAGVTDDRLEVAVSTVPHPERPMPVEQPGGPVITCPAAGYSYLFGLRLPVAFVGSSIDDLHGGPLWIPPPERVADLRSIPAGWSLAGIAAEPVVREFGREYRPEIADLARDDDRYLYLAQAFGGLGTDRPIDAIGSVTIHGIEVPIGANGDAGFIASWWLGRDRLTLISFDAGLDRDAFAAMANEVAIPIR